MISSWKQILKSNYTSFDALADFLELSQEQQESCLPKSKFILNVPRRLAEKMEKKKIDDPIFRQFVPLIDEEFDVEGFTKDPLKEVSFQLDGKLLSKYQGRVLIMPTSACAMHCRYCFRRHYPYEKEKGWGEEIDRIKSNESIQEVILSGGDPLSLDNKILGSLLKEISDAPHIQRIRFHSRFPIGIPERIDSEFLALIESLRPQIYFVVHTNHVREVDKDVVFALSKIRESGITVLNHTVLLNGVNDSFEALFNLFQKLINNGILPYYLFQLDRVQGAAHFDVENRKGLELMEQLRGALPGFGVPKFVREIAGEGSKTELTSVQQV